MISLFPKHILSELRIVYRIIIETIKSIKTTGWVNIVIITTMAAILSIFGCLFRTSLGINSFVNSLGSVLEVSVYLNNDVSPDRAASEIRQIGYIDSIKIVTKGEAWDSLRRQMDVPDIRNPLPDTLHVKITNPEYVNQIVERIKHINGVEGVQYAQDLARKMQQVNDITNIATFVVLIILGGLTIFIINNTIHLVIQSRKQEIEIMRLMGVSNWYIKAPYILQGAFYGFCGAELSLIPLNILQTYINQANTFFQVVAPSTNTSVVILSLLVIGISTSALGSILSISKYLKV